MPNSPLFYLDFVCSGMHGFCACYHSTSLYVKFSCPAVSRTECFLVAQETACLGLFHSFGPFLSNDQEVDGGIVV